MLPTAKPIFVAAATAAAAFFPASTVQAVNGYSFLDAQQSVINYDIAQVAPAAPCAALLNVAGTGASIESAIEVPATASVPAYCKVRGLIAPEIRFEVRLPAHWNRRFYMHGNGGYGGQPIETFYASNRDEAIRHGFATATTNTGHDAAQQPGGTFAYRNRQRKADWAYRAVHVTAAAAKALIRSYYHQPQSFAYFDGCSNGGRQGLISAQRFPNDFDGIVAGAPLLNFTETSISYLWTARALRRAPVAAGKMTMIGDAVLARCDAKDGLKDGLLSDPRTCDFAPERDLRLCAPGQTADCVTDAELATLRTIITGPPANGRPYVHGVLPGSEPAGVIYLPPNDVKSGWFEWVDDPHGPMAYQAHLAEDFLRYMAYPRQDTTARLEDFDFTRDPARMAAGRTLIDAVNPDLKAFRAHGGKLILYHGWADTGVNPLNTIDYFDRVTRRDGETTSASFVRLFMMPGVFHCFGGYGPDRLDAMTPLINWVEHGIAPDAILAAKTERRDGGKLLSTRPICAYPRVARYRGTGGIADAASFACALPEQPRTTDIPPLTYDA